MTTFDTSGRKPRRKKDRGLGAILAELDQSTIADPYKSAQGPVSRAQVRAYGRDTLAPTGDRAYSSFRRTNTSGSDRAGQDFRTFVKRDAQGNAFRYHEYNLPGAKRRVVRVGTALK